MRAPPPEVGKTGEPTKDLGASLPAHEWYIQSAAAQNFWPCEQLWLTEERDILKKPPRTLPGSPGEVRIHQAARAGTQRAAHVQGGPGHRQHGISPINPLAWRALICADLP